MHSEFIKNNLRKRNRAFRVRKKLRGNSERPRLCVVKTNAHIEAQLIDDLTGTTLASASTRAKEHRNTQYGKKNKESAKIIGEKIAEFAKGKNINSVIFDRGPFKYHGILAALAEAARAKGLQF